MLFYLPYPHAPSDSILSMQLSLNLRLFDTLSIGRTLASSGTMQNHESNIVSEDFEVYPQLIELKVRGEHWLPGRGKE